MSGSTDETVVRRSGRGWVVGDEQAPDLTSAMVLADLLAADLAAKTGGAGGTSGTSAAGRAGGAGAPPKPGPRHARPLGETAEQDEAARLAVTVQQLEHALTARVRVEQAIGVLAERHRLRTRDAFDLLRTAARTRGRRVIDIAEEVVDSTSNSLLRLPEELERKPEPRARIRAARRSRPVS
ncbi:MAG: ANTAR domain-containing protein [Actinobacteria bacterium]|nr:ANTAR domain-containing protein [Actinomycetota bacterium]